MIDERVYSIFRFYSHTQTNKEWSTFLLYSGILSNCFLKVWILWWFSFYFLCSVVVTNTDEVQSIGVQSIMAGKWEGRVKKPPAGRRKSIVYSTKRQKKNRLNNDSNDWCTLNSDDTDPHNNVIFFIDFCLVWWGIWIYIYMLDVPNDGKQMNTLSPFPVKTKENKQEVAIKYWWWRTKKNHNDSSKITKKVLIRTEPPKYRGATVDIQEHDVMELDATHFLIRRRHISIVRFRGTSTHPTYMHAITHDARSTQAHTDAAENAREYTGIEKFTFKQIKKHTPS